MGICDEVDEKYMDAITAVSGSGPGYMSIIIEALTYAGLKVGLPRNIALNCAAQTVLGTGKLVTDLHEEPATHQRHDHHTRRNHHRSHLPNRTKPNPPSHDARNRGSHQKKPNHQRKTQPDYRQAMFEAAIFDWDGTLADTRHPNRRFFSPSTQRNRLRRIH